MSQSEGQGSGQGCGRAPARPRPRIGRARLPPVERAKMRPLVEDGGVQLRARFEHRRYADYASSTRSLGAAARDGGHAAGYDFEPQLQGAGASPSLSAKSCDNIFSRHWSSCAPQLWRESTRSEEVLYAVGQHDSPQRQTMTSAQSMGHVASQQPSGAKARIAALLKKLSPRGLRRSRSQPSTAGETSTLPCPWLLVEFSPHDLNGAGCRDSGGSDRSFDLAVSESQQRKEEHIRKQQSKEQISSAVCVVPTILPLQPKFVTPKILVASPGSSTGHSLASSFSVNLITNSDNHSSSLPVSPSKPRLMPKPTLVQGGSSGGGGSGSCGEGAPAHAASGDDIRGASHAPAPAGGRPAAGSPRARAAPAPRPRTAPPPPPISAAGFPLRQPRPLAAAMTSLDSIGSCSLDAYASSSEGTDPFTGTTRPTIDPTNGHGKNHHIIREKADEDLGSGCTLCSVSALSSSKSPQSVAATKIANVQSQSPEYVRRTARLFEESSAEEEAEFTNIPAAKKPSYLGLACSLSGYSGLTSYDSKLREGFRTRDRSPAPPPPRPLTSASMPKRTLSTANGIEKGSGAHTIRSSSPHSTRVNGAMSDQTGEGDGISAREINSASTLFESSRHFMSSMLADETDFTSSGAPSSTQCLTINDSDTVNEKQVYPLKRSPGTIKIVEFTSQGKSYINSSSTSTSRTSTQSFTLYENNQFGSVGETLGKVTNGPDDRQATPIPAYTVSDPSIALRYTASKSFVQQRIERLYGPGALAQGFFSRTRQHSSQEESASQNPEPPPVDACPGNHALPVLRHLRPEFRAQLSLTSTNVTRSLSQTSRMIPPIFERHSVPLLQQQSSVESLSDSQPAAPEVPVLAGPTLPLCTIMKTGDTLLSPKLCEDTSHVEKMDVPVDNPVLNHVEQPLAHSEKLPIFRPPSETYDTNMTEEEKDGHHFLKVLCSEMQRLSKMVEATETELLVEPQLPEEAQGKLRAASGQARLLMKQKLQQFEGLCHKNINQSPDEVFPTTSQDLAGFWDMVKLQVDHVDRLFREIDQLRNSGWVEATGDSQYGSGTASASLLGTRRRQTSRRGGHSSSSGCRTKWSSEDQKKEIDPVRKSREDLARARKKMMEERRRVMKHDNTKQESIEIFVPHENGK